MKKSRIARKCNPRSGFTIAQLASGHKSSQPQRIVLGLKDGKSEIVTFDSFRPIGLKSLGLGRFKHSELLPAKMHFVEVREMTKSNVKKLRSLGYHVQVLGTAVNFNETSSIIRAVKVNTRFTASGNLSLVDSIARKTGITRRRGGSVRYRGSRGGCGGFPGGSGGGHFHAGGGGSGSYNRDSEKKFLVLILSDNEKKREELMSVLERLDEQDRKIRKRLHEITTDDDEVIEPDPKKKVFRSDIKDSMMADAMYEVYEKTLGDNEEARKKNYSFKPIDLMAFLFIMVDIYHYGRDDFHKNGKRPFFEFFIAKVRPELGEIRGITRETMGNRIRRDFDCLYLTDEEKAKKPLGFQIRIKGVEKDFHTICGIFHKTRLGTILHNNT